METSNNISDSILGSSNSTYSSPSSSSSSSSPSMFSSSSISSSPPTGIFDTIKNTSITTWLMIILVLAFLGINIFVYLAKGTNSATVIIDFVLKQIIEVFKIISQKIVLITGTGVSTIFNGTQNVINGDEKKKERNEFDDNIDQNTSANFSHPIEDNDNQPDETKNNILNKVMNKANVLKNNIDINNDNNLDYEPAEAQSSVVITGKPEWCYVGKVKGSRSCVKVGEDDECMSGDIFPTKEKCINPNLRT